MNRWVLLFCMVFPAVALAAPETSTIDVTLKNSSLFEQTLLVRDDLCPAPVSAECTLAEAVVKSDECRRKSNLPECRQARQLLDTGCVTGVNHTLVLKPGETRTIGICANERGQGKISTRKQNSRVWTRRFWLQHRTTIDIP